MHENPFTVRTLPQTSLRELTTLTYKLGLVMGQHVEIFAIYRRLSTAIARFWVQQLRMAVFVCSVCLTVHLYELSARLDIALCNLRISHILYVRCAFKCIQVLRELLQYIVCHLSVGVLHFLTVKAA